VQLVVGIKPDDLRIREAKVGDDILDVASQDFLESLDIQVLP
jgi:hypothetical protein